MKRFIISAVLLLACYSVDAQTAHFTGCFKDKIDPAIAKPFLTNASNPSEPYIPVEVKSDGSFEFDLKCPKPTRYIMALEEPHTGLMLYVEEGMKADLQINFKEVSENGMDRVACVVDYTGDNKDCYDYLQTASFGQDINPLLTKYYGKDNPDLTFGTFREEMRCIVDKAEAQFCKIGTTAFRKYMKEDYEMKFNASLRWYEEMVTKFDSAYDTFMNIDNHDDPADMQTAMSYGSYVRKFKTPEGNDKTVYFLKNIRNYYSNPTVIAAVASQVATNVMNNAPANIEEIYQAYKAAVGTPALAVEQVYNHYKSFVPGAPGVNFTMQDINGKPVKFSQLKGKAVYFDMWATWCGPCCMEIPYMEKLAEHFKGDKRIQIISVSLDKNKEAWKKKINKDKPQWPQYIMPDNFESELCKTYEITGIPRFMMFDKNGKIISIDAPRPSNENIIEWIEGNLKK